MILRKLKMNISGHQQNPIISQSTIDIENRIDDKRIENNDDNRIENRMTMTIDIENRMTIANEKYNNFTNFIRTNNPSKFLSITVKDTLWYIDVSSALIENIFGLYFLLQSSYPGYVIFILFILIDLYKGYVGNILYMVERSTYNITHVLTLKLYWLFFSILMECIQSYIYIQMTITIPTSWFGLAIQLYDLPWYTQSTISFIAILLIQVICILLDYFWNFKEELVLAKERIQKMREKLIEEGKNVAEEDISVGLCLCLCCCWGPVYMSCCGKGFYILIAQGYFTFYQSAFPNLWYQYFCLLMLWVVNDLVGSVIGDIIVAGIEEGTKTVNKQSKKCPESNELEFSTLNKTGIKMETPVPSESDDEEWESTKVVTLMLSMLLFAIFCLVTFIQACCYLSNSTGITSLQFAATILCTLHFFPLGFPLYEIHWSLASLPFILFFIMLILCCEENK